MIKTSICLLLLVTLTGCFNQSADVEPEWCVDSDKRIERFDACLKLLPAGPDKTVYNDWAEVVSTCDNISYVQAKVWRPEGCLAWQNSMSGNKDDR